MEQLIDEWFPGLRDIDTSSGRDLVVPMALCPNCPSEEGVREGEREGGREGGRERGGRESGREREKEGGRDRGREGEGE